MIIVTITKFEGFDIIQIEINNNTGIFIRYSDIQRYGNFKKNI